MQEEIELIEGQPKESEPTVTIWDWINIGIATIIFIWETICALVVIAAGVIGSVLSCAVLVGILLLILAILSLIT